MNLSQVGIIADILWHEIPNHFKFVELGDFIVMPNHIHGILIINKPKFDNVDNNNININVETGPALSIQQPSKQPSQQPIGKQRFQNIGNDTISSIIGSYKSAVTKHANRLGYLNGWQTRFHDHIIRNDQEYQRISDYIVSNPLKWKDDRFFSI